MYNSCVHCDKAFPKLPDDVHPDIREMYESCESCSDCTIERFRASIMETTHRKWFKVLLNPILRKLGWSIVSCYKPDTVLTGYKLRPYPENCKLLDNFSNRRTLRCMLKHRDCYVMEAYSNGTHRWKCRDCGCEWFD